MIFGYLDAGSGSLILQALLGGAAGIAVAWKAWRNKLKAKRGGVLEDVESNAAEESPLTSET